MDSASFTETFDKAIDAGLSWLSDNGGWVFDSVRSFMDGFYGLVLWLLSSPPPAVVAVFVVLLGWRLIDFRFGIFAGLALGFCAVMGLWTETMETLGLVVTATGIALIIGIPGGIVAGYLPALDRVVEPVLDLIQTMPPYIYLLPAIALLGYGPATALFATVVIAMPPAFRLSSLGIRMTPNQFIELGHASGMTSAQMFWKIRLPFAMPSVMAGINQSLMMAFGMVVIAGIVGSGGLGQTIYGAVRTLDIAKSIDAAIAIVILTIVLDRMTQSASASRRQGMTQ